LQKCDEKELNLNKRYIYDKARAIAKKKNSEYEIEKKKIIDTLQRYMKNNYDVYVETLDEKNTPKKWGWRNNGYAGNYCKDISIINKLFVYYKVNSDDTFHKMIHEIKNMTDENMKQFIKIDRDKLILNTD